VRADDVDWSMEQAEKTLKKLKQKAKDLGVGVMQLSTSENAQRRAESKPKQSELQVGLSKLPQA